MKDEKIEGFDKWKIEDDIRTLQSAEEIRGDGKRLKAVGILAKEKLAPLKKLARKAASKGSLGY